MRSPIRGGVLPTRAVAFSVTVLTLIGIFWATLVTWGVGPPTALWVDLAYRGFGVPLIVAGGALWMYGPRPRIGILLIILGMTYYLQFLRVSHNQLFFAVGFCLAFLYVGVFGHLALSVPSGRLRGSLDRTYVAICYVACVGTQIGRYIADRPVAPWNYNIAQVNTGWGIAGSLILAVLGVAGVAIVLRRLLVALAVRRRRSGPVWATMIMIGALIIISALVSATGRSVDVQLMVIVLMLGGATIGVVVAYLVSMGLQLRWQMRIVELPTRLGGPRPPPLTALEAALAESVGDPALRLLMPLDDGSLVTVSGQPVSRRLDPARTLTPITWESGLLCMVEHDAALAETDRAIASAIALTGLVMVNLRLYTQVRDSRRRLLEAELAERRRIERDLHDGAQQGFFVVLTLLGMAQSRIAAQDGPAAELLAQAKSQLTDAMAVLRDLAQGLHPRSLVEHGLRETVAELARRHPGQLRYEVPATRWPPDVESTAYFVIAEGITNALKHTGGGSAIRVEVKHEGDGLVVTVADDGRGGADTSGGGLRGLTERVAAAGGELIIDSPEQGGTRLIAHLPGEFPTEKDA